MKKSTAKKSPLFHQQGFTLIEIMVVVVIISILAALIVPKIMERPDQARIVKAQSDIRVIETTLKLYKLDNYFYPSTDQGLESLVVRPSDDPEPKRWKDGGYLDRLPGDPWDGEYFYLNPGLHGTIDIFSLGADGQPGGEGAKADIGNWDNGR
jgi:general secretion pathway protein G